MKETVIKINKTKSKIKKKIGKPLSRLIRKKREKNQVNSIGKGNGEATIDKA